MHSRAIADISQGARLAKAEMLGNSSNSSCGVADTHKYSHTLGTECAALISSRKVSDASSVWVLLSAQTSCLFPCAFRLSAG